MTQNLHTYVINIFDRSGSNLLTRRMQTYILHSNNYPEAGPICFLLRNLRNNLILSISYKFRMTLRNVYGTRDLAIFVINTSTMLTNILIEYQSSATLLLEYLIVVSLASKIRCLKLHLAMG